MTLYGTASWLDSIGRVLTVERSAQLRRIRSFLKLETVRKYACPKTGRARVAESSRAGSTFIDVEAGGRDLKRSQVYPGDFGIEAVNTMCR